MFEVKIDGLDQLLKKFDTFGKQIEELQQAVPQQLVDWQRDDMHRTFPNLKVDTSGNETAASTEIWPRSRLPSKDTHRPRQGPKQHSPARVMPKQHALLRSTRPILRDELLQKLQDRMTALTTEAMKWP